MGLSACKPKGVYRVLFIPIGSNSSVRLSSSKGRLAATSATRAATLKPIVQ